MATPTTAPKTTRDWVESAIADGHIRSIKFAELCDTKYLTSGGFGMILTATWRRTKVALKKLEVGANIMMDEVVKEIKLLQRTNGHDNIVRLYGVSEHPHTKDLIIVMQYAEKGTLRQLLQNHFSNLNWPTKIRLATQIAKGLEFIHMEGIAHRDLHSKNILIDSDGRALIADFGIAKMVHSVATASSAATGMLQYAPPERLTNSPTGQIDLQKGDIYSLGFIMWELSSGRMPWENVDFYTFLRNVSAGQREEYIEGTPPDYAKLYEECWAQDPQQRPTVTIVLDKLEPMSAEPAESNSPRTSVSSGSGVGFPMYNIFGSSASTFEKSYEEIDSGYISATKSNQAVQLLVFGKEVVLVNVSTGDVSVITKEVEGMRVGTGARAACTTGGKAYFIANKEGNRNIMCYDPLSRAVSVTQSEVYDKTYSLSPYGNIIFACGVRIHKIDVIEGKTSRADLRGGVKADATWYSNNDVSAVVDDVLYFYELGGFFSAGLQHLWALDLSEVNERGHGCARQVSSGGLNPMALFVWRNQLCSLSAKGIVSEINRLNGEETRVLSGDGGDPAACAVWGDSLYVVEQSGKLREVNLATGMGKVIRQLQDVGTNPRSMVALPL